QQWTATSAGELRVYGGTCLDVNGAGPADGTAGIIWDCNGQNNQRCTLNADGRTTAVGANKCLDVSGYGPANGTKVHIWTCPGGTNQKWTRSCLHGHRPSARAAPAPAAGPHPDHGPIPLEQAGPESRSRPAGAGLGRGRASPPAVRLRCNRTAARCRR